MLNSVWQAELGLASLGCRRPSCSQARCEGIELANSCPLCTKHHLNEPNSFGQDGSKGLREPELTWGRRGAPLGTENHIGPHEIRENVNPHSPDEATWLGSRNMERCPVLALESPDSSMTTSSSTSLHQVPPRISSAPSKVRT